MSEADLDHIIRNVIAGIRDAATSGLDVSGKGVFGVIVDEVLRECRLAGLSVSRRTVSRRVDESSDLDGLIAGYITGELRFSSSR